MTTTISPAAIQPSHPRREALGVPDEKARYAIQRDIVIEKINLCCCYRSCASTISTCGSRSTANTTRTHLPTRSADLAPRVYDQMIHYGYRPEGLRPYLADAIRTRNPRRIGLNVSPTLPMADGLTASLKSYLDEAIGPEVAAREVSAELLQRDFRATRTKRETAVYRRLVEWTAVWEEEGLSRASFLPGRGSCATARSSRPTIRTQPSSRAIV